MSDQSFDTDGRIPIAPKPEVGGVSHAELKRAVESAQAEYRAQKPDRRTVATEVDFSAHDLRVTAGAIADDTARHIIQRAATVLAKRETEIERLRSLVKHCWIHSGYQNCGYAQMTTEQKPLYDSIVSKESE